MRRTPVPLLDGRAMYSMALDSGAPIAQRVRLIASLVLHPQYPGSQDDIFQQTLLEAADLLDGKGHGTGVKEGPKKTIPPPVEKNIAPSAYNAVEAVRKEGGDVFYHFDSGSLVAIGKDIQSNTLLDLYNERGNVAALFQEMTDFSDEGGKPTTIKEAVALYCEQFGVGFGTPAYVIPTRGDDKPQLPKGIQQL